MVASAEGGNAFSKFLELWAAWSLGGGIGFLDTFNK